MKEKIIREVGNKLKIKIYFNQVISNFQKKKTKKNSLKIHNINEVKEGENEIIEEEKEKKNVPCLIGKNGMKNSNKADNLDLISDKDLEDKKEKKKKSKSE